MAGYYYPARAQPLSEALEALLASAPAPDPASATAVVLPHGSFRHCGRIIAATLGRVAVPRRCILIGASHTGSAMRWSLMPGGAYQTPLGAVPVDEAAAEALRARCPFLEPDAWAQRGEHSVEVLLPFLQRLAPSDLAIVPIVTSSEEPEQLRQLGEALAQVIRLQEEAVLPIASAELSHEKPVERARGRDEETIRAICALDVPRLTRLTEEDGASLCGYGALAAILQAATALGARGGTLCGYGTSADAGGDPDSAIGYAGVLIR